MKIKLPTEYEEQCSLVDWLVDEKLPFTAIPNGTWTPSHPQKMKNWKMGLRKGFPDMVVVIPADKCKEGRTVMLCIEMKRKKGGVVSLEQKEWIELINQVADCEAMVCRGAEEATEKIAQLLNS